MTSSTLVETVSINYEDFTEGFLTCSTCLCTYDNNDHYPKLLHCSHTVCKSCLEKIASLPGVREAGFFRCPICRETITLPRGGILTLPPSFLVNQLLDLMSSQRREVIPKCSTHNQQELLFCESCDVVFCNVCENGSHAGGNNDRLSRSSPTGDHLQDSKMLMSSNQASSEHTVITFSIAIKRMSEILVYKGHQCIAKLNEAHDNVRNEMRKLDQNSEHAFEDINRTFQEIINIVDRRRQELLALAKKIREDKHSILDDQLKLIEYEKSKVEQEINSLQYDQEVKNITKKINELGDKIDSVNSLLDPRENCFIRYEHLHNEAVDAIQSSVNDFGSIRTSKTFPPLCLASVPGNVYSNLRSLAVITTYDYHGQRQRFGGDPVSVEIRHQESGSTSPAKLVDNRDGTYEAHFIPVVGGRYALKVCIFGRPIKSYPVYFDVCDSIKPTAVFGSRGNDCLQFNQPVGLTVSNSKDGKVYVLDTGNGRIKVLAPQLSSPSTESSCNGINNVASSFSFLTHIEGNGLENKSATGIALNRDSHSLFISNWRNKDITEIDLKGNFLRHFSHSELSEATYLCVNSKGEIIVADNGSQAIFVFHPSGKLARKICLKDALATSTTSMMSKTSSSLSLVSKSSHHHNTTSSVVMSALAVGPDDEIIMADSVIHVFNSEGEKIREMYPEGRNKGHFGGVCADGRGFLIATRVDKTKSVVQVFDWTTGTLKFIVSSPDAKLKRPSSVVCTNDFHAIVVDLGNDCIKKYRYH